MNRLKVSATAAGGALALLALAAAMGVSFYYDIKVWLFQFIHPVRTMERLGVVIVLMVAGLFILAGLQKLKELWFGRSRP